MNGIMEKERTKIRKRALQHASLDIAKTLVAIGATREEAAEMLEYACKVAYGEYCFSRNDP